MVKVNPEELEIWSPEVENLLADWSEKASGYRWLHARAEKRYRRRYYSFSIPVIILSTLSGVASAGLNTYVPEDSLKTGQAIIGGVNIFAGILGTLQNFLRVAEQMEGHRSSSVSWSKLSRAISIELALDPKRRQVCHDFLKVTRAEYDRLIEQSPLVPDEIISNFKSKFKSYDVSKPAIANGLDKCVIFDRDDAKPSVKQKDKEELLAELKEATDEDEASEQEPEQEP